MRRRGGGDGNRECVLKLMHNPIRCWRVQGIRFQKNGRSGFVFIVLSVESPFFL